jgi:RNA polymerase sigma factor (sigma-70 family)
LAWVRTIADHRLVDALRKFDRGGATQLSPASDAHASSFRELIDAVCQDSVTPSKRARDREAIHAIQIALSGLPADQQEVIRLHYLHHKSVEEISRETGRTEGAIRGLMYRGKANLAAAMGRSSRWLSSS